MLILAVLGYAFIMQILLYSVLKDVQDHDGKDRCVFSHILKLYSAVIQKLQSLEQHDLLGECRTYQEDTGSAGRSWEATVSTHLCHILDNPQFIYSMGFFTAKYFKLGIGIASLTSFL